MASYNARPNKTDKYIQGYYNLINEKKYIANPAAIVYRSGLELKFCTFADKNPKVLKWGSECCSVDYIGGDNKKHTYYIDFYLEIENPKHPAGYDRVYVEVKPEVEVARIIKGVPPEKPKKCTPTSLRNWEYAMKEYQKNVLKWKTAKKYCDSHNINFMIVTEKVLSKLTL
jgi:hypothetical protein